MPTLDCPRDPPRDGLAGQGWAYGDMQMARYRTVTVADVLSWRPCWHPDDVRDAMRDRERWRAQDFARLYLRGGILAAEEFLWVVLRDELWPADTLHSLAARFAIHGLEAEREAGREPHPVLWAAAETKLRWAAGKATHQQMIDARDAADNAMRDHPGWGKADLAARETAYAAREASQLDDPGAIARETAWFTARAAASSAIAGAGEAEIDEATITAVSVDQACKAMAEMVLAAL